MKQLYAEVHQAHDHHARSSLKLEKIETRLLEMIEELSAISDPELNQPAYPRIPRVGAAAREIRMAAEEGISGFRFERRDDGSADVQVGDAKFAAPRALADLLEVLKQRDEKGTVPWKSIAEIGSALNGASERVIRQRISRLRLLFLANFVNPWFIRTGPPGARLALRDDPGAGEFTPEARSDTVNSGTQGVIKAAHGSPQP